MSNGLYLASPGPASGKSVVALGIMELLSRRIDRLGYFRPVVPTTEEEDTRIALIRGRYPLSTGDVPLAGYGAAEVQDLIAEGRQDEVLKRLVERFHRVQEQCDFVLVDGSDYTGVAAPLEFDFNAVIATHLGTPVLAIVNGRDRDPADVVDAVRVARESLGAAGCAVAATIVNRVDPAAHADTVATLDGHLAEHEPFYVLPEEPLLGMPTVDEIARSLGARDLRGDRADRHHEVAGYKVAAMRLEHFLEHIREDALIITPGDRADIVLGCFTSRASSTYPNIAGLLLTGGLDPDPSVLHLIDGLTSLSLPVVAVDDDTFTAAEEAGRVRAVLRPEDDRRIATALGVFEEHVDVRELAQAIEVARSDRVTPLMFEYELMERARGADKHIVLPEGTDDRILQAAQLLRRRGVVRLTLLGDEDEVRSRIAALGLDLDDVPVVDPASSELREPFAQRYHELRRHKGITEEQAAEAMLDGAYFGTMLVQEGHVDGMVSGAAHTTAHTIRPALEFIRTKPGVTVVSSVFLMCLADRVLVYGDCAVNPNPTAEQLADIALSSAATAQRFGVDARVAMLSYSTGESGRGADVDVVREATRLARERAPELPIDGPLQYDAAVDASVGAAKLPDSDVAGRATVFVFPDLNTGNNTYKAVQRSAGAVAIGPILQGLNKPVNDLSRGCLVPDVVNTVAITAVQAADE